MGNEREEEGDGPGYLSTDLQRASAAAESARCGCGARGVSCTAFSGGGDFEYEPGDRCGYVAVWAIEFLPRFYADVVGYDTLCWDVVSCP